MCFLRLVAHVCGVTPGPDKQCVGWSYLCSSKIKTYHKLYTLSTRRYHGYLGAKVRHLNTIDSQMIKNEIILIKYATAVDGKQNENISQKMGWS